MPAWLQSIRRSGGSVAPPVSGAAPASISLEPASNVTPESRLAASAPTPSELPAETWQPHRAASTTPQAWRISASSRASEPTHARVLRIIRARESGLASARTSPTLAFEPVALHPYVRLRERGRRREQLDGLLGPTRLVQGEAPQVGEVWRGSQRGGPLLPYPVVAELERAELSRRRMRGEGEGALVAQRGALEAKRPQLRQGKTVQERLQPLDPEGASFEVDRLEPGQAGRLGEVLQLLRVEPRP